MQPDLGLDVEVEQGFASGQDDSELGRLAARADADEHDDSSSAVDTIDRYWREVQRIPLLTPEDERELGARALAGDPDAVRRLVEANLRLVVRFARRFCTKIQTSFTLLDLIQEGNVGLIRAAQTFDPSKGRFSTYAAWWIQERIARAIKLRGPLVRVPVQFSGRDRSLALEAIGDGKDAAVRVGVAPERLRDIQRACRYPLSLDTPLTNEDGEARSLHEVFADPRSTADDAMGAWPIDPAQLRTVIESLDEREAAVLRLRFGLDDGVELTLRETGERIGVTYEYIRYIEAKALDRLRKRLNRLAWGSGEPSAHTNGHGGTLAAPYPEDVALIGAATKAAGSKRALAERLGLTPGTLSQMGLCRPIPECHRAELRRIVEAAAGFRATAGAANGTRATVANGNGNGHTNGHERTKVRGSSPTSGLADGHFPWRSGGVRLPPATDPVAPVRIMDASGQVLDTLTPEAFRARAGSTRCLAHGRAGCRKCAERPAPCPDCGASLGVSGICRSCRPIAHLGGAAMRRKSEERRHEQEETRAVGVHADQP